jgi:hypothetical protein
MTPRNRPESLTIPSAFHATPSSPRLPARPRVEPHPDAPRQEATPRKRPILSTIAALVLAGLYGQAHAAVETYQVNLNGYAVVGFVGSTPEEFALAQHQANRWEMQRHLMLKPQSIKAVAIDQSKGVALDREQLRQAIVSAALAKVP